MDGCMDGCSWSISRLIRQSICPTAKGPLSHIQLTWPGWQQLSTSCCQTAVPTGHSPSAVYQPDRTKIQQSVIRTVKIWKNMQIYICQFFCWVISTKPLNSGVFSWLSYISKCRCLDLISITHLNCYVQLYCVIVGYNLHVFNVLIAYIFTIVNLYKLSYEYIILN